MNNNPAAPLLILSFEKKTEQGIRYCISDDANGDQLQKVQLDTKDLSITFCEPLSELYVYLKANEKWLRSILYTTLNIEDPSDIKIPICFPVDKPKGPAPEECIKIYSDGSCDNNDNGGWGSVMIDCNKKIHEFYGSEKNSTSNRVELMAAVEGIKHTVLLLGVNKPLLVITDSLYVIRGITHRLQVWQRNGFITAMGKEVVNHDLWIELAELIKRSDIYCQWIESGSDKYNRRCDSLAKKESRKLTGSKP